MEIAAPADQHRAAAAPATRKRPISYLPSRTLISSGIPRRYSVNNPVIGVDKLVHDEEGAKPWPEDGYRFVMANAPEDFAPHGLPRPLHGTTRLRSGAHAPVDLVHDGFNVRIGKLRELRHFVPLTLEQMAEKGRRGPRSLPEIDERQALQRRSSRLAMGAVARVAGHRACQRTRNDHPWPSRDSGLRSPRGQRRRWRDRGRAGHERADGIALCPSHRQGRLGTCQPRPQRAAEEGAND